MKPKTIFYVILGLALFAALASISHAQCIDGLAEKEKWWGYKFEDKEELNEEDQKKALPKKTRTYSAIRVVVPKDTRFKVSLDTEVNAGFAKPNDNISFTVLENVYANAVVLDIKGELVPKRCVAIAKGTKLYGLVDFSRPSYPFYIGGRSRVGVFIQELRLDSSDSIKDENPVLVSFVEPITKGTPYKTVIRPCHHFKGQLCILGRRNKPTLPPTAGGAFAAGVLFANDDKGTNLLGWVTAFKELTDATGISELINPSKATLNSNMIFDVAVKSDQQVWVPVAPPAKDDKK